MRLRTNIASPLLLDCLRKIMASKAFDDLYLVGGTALALQRGHGFPLTLTLDNIIEGFKRLPLLNDYSEIRCLKGKYWEFIVEDLMEQIPILEKMVLQK